MKANLRKGFLLLLLMVPTSWALSRGIALALAGTDSEWYGQVASSVMVVAFYIVLWALIFGGIGRFIGSYRNRGREGFFFGLLLGPIGWIIAALLPDNPRRRCQACLKGVPEEATKCCHCGSDLRRSKSTLKDLEELQEEKEAIIAARTAEPIVRIPWEKLEQFERCPCRVCNVNIEFPASGVGQTVRCPKCGCETTLYATKGASAT